MLHRSPMLAEEWFSRFIRKQKSPDRFSELKSYFILKTLERLNRRIRERFPDSGLSQVCAELCDVGASVEQMIRRLRRPIWIVRIFVLAVIIGIIVLAVYAINLSLELASIEMGGLMELLQGIESAINEIIFLALAIFFLGTLESRLKRYVALRALHRLRSIAHVVDMHQLTKDPAYILQGTEPTASSPERTMTPHQLTRYLDYCTEMLSIVSKLAALRAQHVNDPVVLNAVNDVETLAHGLAGKIWQKIMIIDAALPNVSTENA